MVVYVWNVSFFFDIICCCCEHIGCWVDLLTGIICEIRLVVIFEAVATPLALSMGIIRIIVHVV